MPSILCKYAVPSIVCRVRQLQRSFPGNLEHKRSSYIHIVTRNACTYHTEEITRMLFHISKKKAYYCDLNRVDERDLSDMVWGPTFLSLIAWRQVYETWLQTRSFGISGNIIRYVSLTPRPEILCLILSFYVNSVILVFYRGMAKCPESEVVTIIVPKKIPACSVN